MYNSEFELDRATSHCVETRGSGRGQRLDGAQGRGARAASTNNTLGEALSTLVEQFRVNDGRVGSVFQKLDAFTLTEILERCRARGEQGLPERHLVWLLRRCLAALDCAHKQGILHGNLDPSHILVRPHDHMVWLISWCWAIVRPAETGQSFKVHNEVFSPPEVAQKARPSPASDFYALGKCMLYVLGGKVETKTLPELEPRLARFLKYLMVESRADGLRTPGSCTSKSIAFENRSGDLTPSSPWDCSEHSDATFGEKKRFAWVVDTTVWTLPKKSVVQQARLRAAGRWPDAPAHGGHPALDPLGKRREVNNETPIVVALDVTPLSRR